MCVYRNSRLGEQLCFRALRVVARRALSCEIVLIIKSSRAAVRAKSHGLGRKALRSRRREACSSCASRNEYVNTRNAEMRVPHGREEVRQKFPDADICTFTPPCDGCECEFTTILRSSFRARQRCMESGSRNLPAKGAVITRIPSCSLAVCRRRDPRRIAEFRATRRSNCDRDAYEATAPHIVKIGGPAHLGGTCLFVNNASHDISFPREREYNCARP